MIVKYEFNTASEDYDRAEYEMYKQAPDMAHALFEIDNRMRSWLKYNQCPMINETSFFWEDLTEEKKQFYKEYQIPDIDKMTDEIYDIIRENVNMEKMGY